MKQYTKTHEWAEVRDGLVYVGISAHAAHELGDIVYVSLPDTESAAETGRPLCEIESVKAVAEVNSPVDGRVVKVNGELADAPELLSENPELWICAVEPSAPLAGLMSEAEYKVYSE